MVVSRISSVEYLGNLGGFDGFCLKKEPFQTKKKKDRLSSQKSIFKGRENPINWNYPAGGISGKGLGLGFRNLKM